MFNGRIGPGRLSGQANGSAFSKSLFNPGRGAATRARLVITRTSAPAPARSANDNVSAFASTPLSAGPALISGYELEPTQLNFVCLDNRERSNVFSYTDECVWRHKSLSVVAIASESLIELLPLRLITEGGMMVIWCGGAVTRFRPIADFLS